LVELQPADPYSSSMGDRRSFPASVLLDVSESLHRFSVDSTRHSTRSLVFRQDGYDRDNFLLAGRGDDIEHRLQQGNTYGPPCRITVAAFLTHPFVGGTEAGLNRRGRLRTIAMEYGRPGSRLVSGRIGC
jgi:hypothetical protein